MEKPKRILQVFTIMNRGGAESMIMSYYRNIDRSKVQFDFLVHRFEKGAFDEEIEQLGGQIFRIAPIPFFNLNKYQKKLDKFFKEHQYNIIHSHLNAMSKYVLKIAKKNNTNTRIAHSHIALPILSIVNIREQKLSIIDIFKIFYKNIAKKNITNYATNYFACEQKAANWLFNNTSEVHIINNAIDSRQFRYNEEKSHLLKIKLGLNNKLIFGHVGRFNTQKNHLFLISIFYEIQKLQPNSILLLVGDGILKAKMIDKVEKLSISNKIVFLGVRSDIPEILQSFDIFLFPSLFEGLPVTLIEAQASGLKCFTSNTIDKDVDISGLINPISLEKSAKEWATIILENKDYTRKDQYQTIVKNGYDIKENAKKLENFYLSQLSKC